MTLPPANRPRLAILDSLTAFDPLRWTFAQLYGKLLEAYGEGTAERETLLDNARFGARVDLLIDRLRAELRPP